ncbi:hypothetical protein HL42_2804 [Trichophyton rubrum]|nr:hypothetical protein HL42_2804 [Trichophyton rubrum]
MQGKMFSVIWTNVDLNNLSNLNANYKGSKGVIVLAVRLYFFIPLTAVYCHQCGATGRGGSLTTRGSKKQYYVWPDKAFFNIYSVQQASKDAAIERTNFDHSPL